MTYQVTPSRNGNYRRPMPRAGQGQVRRRRTPTAYLIASRAEARRDPYASLRGLSRELAGLRGRMGPVRGLGFASAASIATSSSTALSASLPAWFIPVIGPAVAAATFGISKLFNRPAGKQKLAATQIVEEATRAMEENLLAFQGGPHTQSSKAQALANFDAAWQFIKDNCGNPELGDAGRRCINERQRGSSATCFINGTERSCDLFKAFRDPISGATGIVPDPTIGEQIFGGGSSAAGGGAGGDLLGAGGGGVSPLVWIIGGGALIYFATR